MAGWNEMSGAARGGVVTAVVVVLGVVGWTIVDRGPAPQPAAGIAEPGAVAPAPAETAAAATGVAIGVAEPAVEPAALMAPTIDVLRVTPDGSATLAGRTEALAEVSIEVDGTEVARVTADASGQFASVFTLLPSTSARLLTLGARLADGTLLPATEGVAIAPVAEAGIAVAAAEPAAEPATDLAAEPATEPATGPAAPAAIKVTEAGAEVLQPSEPVAADLAAEVSLDVISYAADGSVQLGGRGTAGADLRLYLDNVELATTRVGPDGGWSLNSADIAPGLYTLRVDQLDASGAVTSRLETPFKRETLEALAAAAVTAPAEPLAPATEVAAAEPAASEPAATEPAAAEPAKTAEATAEVTAEAAPLAAPLATDPGTAQTATPEVASDAGAAVAPEADSASTLPAAEAGVAEPAALASAEAPAADAAPAAPAAPITVTVQPGFTLWAIARETFGSGVMYVQVFEANKDKIKDPDLIYPGQVFSLPASP